MEQHLVFTLRHHPIDREKKTPADPLIKVKGESRP
jgi:hypothetical protein